MTKTKKMTPEEIALTDKWYRAGWDDAMRHVLNNVTKKGITLELFFDDPKPRKRGKKCG